MEMYKQINKAVSQQNQELRQTVATLKNENISLNRKLMNEKELVVLLRRTILRCVSQASYALNEIVTEISTNEMRAEMQQVPAADETNNSSVTRRQTIRRVQPTVREPEMRRQPADESEKENSRSEFGDESVERFANVQTRRRRLSEPMKEKDTNIPLVQVEDEKESDEDEIESDEDDEEYVPERDEDVVEVGDEDVVVEREEDDVEKREEDDVNPSNADTLTTETRQSYTSLNRDIPTIIEENTITDSQTSYTLNVQRTVRNTMRENQSVLTVEDSTTFANFSALKAMSSTPYKTKNALNLRPVRVLIQKLNPAVIKTSQAINKNTKDKAKSKRNDKENKSANALSISNSSRNTRNSMQVLTERSGNTSDISTRPKRSAAPSSLKEPSLTQKLRRKI